MKRGMIATLPALALALTACGGSSLSLRQVADAVADHSACKDVKKYINPKATSVTDTCSNETSSTKYTYCSSGTRADDPVFYYQDDNGDQIGIVVMRDDHRAWMVYDVDQEYGSKC